MKKTVIDTNPNWVNEVNMIIGLPQSEASLRELLVYQVETAKGFFDLNNKQHMTPEMLNECLKNEWANEPYFLLHVYKMCFSAGTIGGCSITRHFVPVETLKVETI